MSNSKWKPFSEIPDEGTFLVWAPKRPDGRGAYVGNRSIAIHTRQKNLQGQIIALTDGYFHWDVKTPVYYTEIDNLLEDLPIDTDA